LRLRRILYDKSVMPEELFKCYRHVQVSLVGNFLLHFIDRLRDRMSRLFSSDFSNLKQFIAGANLIAIDQQRSVERAAGRSDRLPIGLCYKSRPLLLPSSLVLLHASSCCQTHFVCTARDTRQHCYMCCFRFHLRYDNKLTVTK
jgi:hypothetical protein